MQSKIKWAVLGAAALSLIWFTGCESMSQREGHISSEPFGATPDGTPVQLYTLRNSRGMEARIMNYGGTVVSLTAPDRHGQYADVVLGYDRLADYIASSPYFGCLVGRYGNRIAKAQFKLNGQTYQLAANNEGNSLHGGLKGFDKVVWQSKSLASPLGPALELTYLSKDGEEGYPGNLSIKAVYTLTEENSLRLDFSATTDKDTVVNLTHHSYFNLAGKGDVLGHEVYLNASRFTPVDATLIPIGEMRPVKGTPLDFTKSTAIGARINQDDQQLKLGKGYDHNWVLNKSPGALALAGRVYEPTTGRVLEAFTTEPGMQFYTGNFLDGTLTGKGGWVYQFRNGFCLEPQHFPDSPNQPGFPTTVLKPGQIYKNTIIYKFSAK